MATVNGSCSELRGRIIESFIGLVGDLTTSRSLCQPRHRCRVRNTFVFCRGDAVPPPPGSDEPATAPPGSRVAAAENVTVDFVLETELRPNSSRPVTLADQRNLIHSMDDVFHAFSVLVTDGELTWWTQDSQLVAVSLGGALPQFDMDNCTAGQILNDRNSDAPACRKWIACITLRSTQQPLEFLGNRL